MTRPVDDWARFGEKMRAGDVNGDGIVDLVEGAPDRPDEYATGHLSFCEGKRSGRPKRCEAIDNSAGTGTSALAVADVNGDNFEDVIQGDAVPEFGVAPLGGQVRIWRGSRHGPAGEPLVVVQGEDFIPGSDELGDSFGAGVDSGKLDRDRYADIVVTAPGEGSGAGALTVVRGGSAGIARTGHAGFAMGIGVPGDMLAGRRLGWSVAVLELSGDKRLDVATAVRGADRIQESVYVIEGPRRGNFAPNETRSWPLLHGPVRVRDADSRRLRLGRMDGA